MLPKIQVSAKNAMISVKELLFGLVFACLWWPIVACLTLLNLTLQTLAQTAYDFFYPRGTYTVMVGEDSVFGHRIKGNCNSLIQGYQIIEGTPNLGLIRSKFEKLLQSPETSADYARLKSIFTHKFGYFCWKKDPVFNLSRHIRLLDDWDGSQEADEGKLMDIVGRLVREDMKDDKPQWEVLLVPRYYTGVHGSGERHYALITRFNHAYSDAISYFLMINNYIADFPAKLPLDPTKLPFKVPLWAQAVVWAKAAILGPYSFAAIMATYIFDRSVFATPYYSHKKICGRSPPIALQTIKDIRQASKSSVTAVLYTAVYSALYKAHVREFGRVEVPEALHLGSVIAMWPYWGKKKLGNQFTLWPYTAPLKIEGNCLKERLRISHEVSQQGLGSAGPLFNFYLTRMLGSIPKLFHPLLWQLSGCPLMLSNVPGFSSKLHIYGGEMVDAAGFLPLTSTIGIGLSTQTYCGEMRFNAVVDPKVFARKVELQRFLDDIISELQELSVLYRVSHSVSNKVNVKHQEEQEQLDENGNPLQERKGGDKLELFLQQAISS